MLCCELNINFQNVPLHKHAPSMEGFLAMVLPKLCLQVELKNSEIRKNEKLGYSATKASILFRNHHWEGLQAFWGDPRVELLRHWVHVTIGVICLFQGVHLGEQSKKKIYLQIFIHKSVNIIFKNHIFHISTYD